MIEIVMEDYDLIIVYGQNYVFFLLVYIIGIVCVEDVVDCVF